MRAQCCRRAASPWRHGLRNCEPKRSDNVLQIRKGRRRLAFENNVTDYIISTVLYGLYDGI